MTRRDPRLAPLAAAILALAACGGGGNGAADVDADSGGDVAADSDADVSADADADADADGDSAADGDGAADGDADADADVPPEADACVPITCELAGWDCGTIADGCGGTDECGACDAPDVCGGGGVAGACAPCSPGVWVTATVAAAGDVGKESSLALAPGGTVLIAYRDRTAEQLKLAAGGLLDPWTFEIVTGDGENPSLGVAPSGDLHLTYVGYTTDAYLGYATRSGGAWTADDTWIYHRSHADLVVDSGGAVHVAMFDTFLRDLLYRRRPPGGPDAEWALSSFEYDLPSIDVGAAGVVHIAAFEADGHTLAYLRTAAPDDVLIETVDDGPGGTTYFSGRIAVDEAGVVHIAYRQVPPGDLKYARRDLDGTWALTTIEAGAAPSGAVAIALAGDGTVHVVCWNTAWALEHASLAPGGSWAISTVDSGPGIGDWGGLGLAAEDDGALHVSYYDGATRDLRYAHRCAP